VKAHLCSDLFKGAQAEVIAPIPALRAQTDVPRSFTLDDDAAGQRENGEPGYVLIGPKTLWFLVAALFCASGQSRSMHFTSLNTLPFSDVPQSEMAMANLIFNVSF
jgi:hypothetical protein